MNFLSTFLLAITLTLPTIAVVSSFYQEAPKLP